MSNDKLDWDIPGFGMLDKASELFERKPLKVSESSCSNSRYRHFNCQLCEEVCPEAAISLNDDPHHPLEVDFSSCNGCGLCAVACPTGVFEAQTGFTDYELMEKIRLAIEASEEKELAFSCTLYKDFTDDPANSAAERQSGRAAADEPTNQPANQPADEDNSSIKVSCLGRLHEALLIGAVAAGGRRLWLEGHNCRDCRIASGKAVIERSITATRELIQLFQFNCEVMLTDQPLSDIKMAQAEVPYHPKERPNRREFLTSLSGGFKKAGLLWLENTFSPILPPPEKDMMFKGYSRRIPTKRTLLLHCLPQKDITQNGTDLKEAPFFDLNINMTACNLCGHCELFCPAGALLFKDTDAGETADQAETEGSAIPEEPGNSDEFIDDEETLSDDYYEDEGEGETQVGSGRFYFISSRCTGCGLCAFVCEEKALQVSRAIPEAGLRSPTVIADYQSYECTSCTTVFASIGYAELCGLCAKMENMYAQEAEGYGEE